MKTVHEISRITGVSVRTLHYYDSIGILKPSKITDAGYRLYDDTALERLQTILLFRELQFPLKEIKTILESPDFNRIQALKQQVELLELKRKHLGELITFARKIIKTGVNTMDFSIFDKSEIEQYTNEAKEKWGRTSVYAEYEQKTNDPSAADISALNTDLMRIFKKTGEMMNLSPDDTRVQTLIARLQKYITDHYYTCTPEILRSLGQMYAGDERFKSNIDTLSGEGTAKFVNEAIEIYCNK